MGSYTPEVGVEVREVLRDPDSARRQLLVGAKVDLSDDPIFKGENGVVAEDGKEPIVPFVLRIAKDDVVLVRSCPDTPEYTESSCTKDFKRSASCPRQAGSPTRPGSKAYSNASTSGSPD